MCAGWNNPASVTWIVVLDLPDVSRNIDTLRVLLGMFRRGLVAALGSPHEIREARSVSITRLRRNESSNVGFVWTSKSPRLAETTAPIRLETHLWAYEKNERQFQLVCLRGKSPTPRGFKINEWQRRCHFPQKLLAGIVFVTRRKLLVFNLF